MEAAHVLVVEDDELLSRAWRRTASRLRLRLSLAADARQAETILRSGHVSAVVADFNLRAGTSAALVLWLRRERPTVPVLVITGDPNAARAALGGLVVVLEKPITPADVLARLVLGGLSTGPAS